MQNQSNGVDQYAKAKALEFNPEPIVMKEHPMFKSKFIDSDGNDLSTIEGTKAAMKKEEELRKRMYTPVAPGTSTYYFDKNDESIFDVKPMLKYLHFQEGQEVLKHLNYAINDLTSHYIDGEGNGLNHASEVLRMLRDLQAAMLSGFRLVDLDKHYAAIDKEQ